MRTRFFIWWDHPHFHWRGYKLYAHNFSIARNFSNHFASVAGNLYFSKLIPFDPLNRRAGEPEGREAMESTGRQSQGRFKRPGQFWSCAGDEALICLKTSWRNNRWHLLFPHSIHGDPRKN